MSGLAHYRHDLGNGMYFDAFSLSPEISESRLKEVARDLDGKANLNLSELKKIIVKKASVAGLGGLEITASEKGGYSVPEPLKAYREAIAKKWDSEGKFNGPVLIVDGELKVPLKVMQGGYYDFATTKLKDIPAKLLPEVYPEGKTVGDILVDNGISLEERARYFGLAHLMWPSEGKEFLLVQRAKGMGIAADCVSTPGSTPDVQIKKLGLKKPEFGMNHYWSYHLAEEMKDEFKLKWGDFWTGKIDFFEDSKAIPFGAVEIITPLPTSEIAEQAYGDSRVLKEHTILYSMNREAIHAFLQRIPVLYSLIPVLSELL